MIMLSGRTLLASRKPDSSLALSSYLSEWFPADARVRALARAERRAGGEAARAGVTKDRRDDFGCGGNRSTFGMPVSIGSRSRNRR